VSLLNLAVAIAAAATAICDYSEIFLSLYQLLTNYNRFFFFPLSTDILIGYHTRISDNIYRARIYIKSINFDKLVGVDVSEDDKWEKESEFSIFETRLLPMEMSCGLSGVLVFSPWTNQLEPLHPVDSYQVAIPFVNPFYIACCNATMEVDTREGFEWVLFDI